MFNKEENENVWIKISNEEMFKDKTDTLSTILAKNNMVQTGVNVLQFVITKDENERNIIGLHTIHFVECVKREEENDIISTYFYLKIERDEFYEDEDTENSPFTISETWNHGEHKGYCIINGDKRSLFTGNMLSSDVFINFYDPCDILPKGAEKKIMELAPTIESLEYISHYLKNNGYNFRGKIKDKLKKHNGPCFYFINLQKCTGMKLYLDDKSYCLYMNNNFFTKNYADFSSPYGIDNDNVMKIFLKNGLLNKFHTRFNILYFMYKAGGLLLQRAYPGVFINIINNLLSEGGYLLVEKGNVDDADYEVYASADKFSAIILKYEEITKEYKLLFYDSMSGYDQIEYVDDLQWITKDARLVYL